MSLEAAILKGLGQSGLSVTIVTFKPSQDIRWGRRQRGVGTPYLGWAWECFMGPNCEEVRLTPEKNWALIPLFLLRPEISSLLLQPSFPASPLSHLPPSHLTPSHPTWSSASLWNSILRSRELFYVLNLLQLLRCEASCEYSQSQFL